MNHICSSFRNQFSVAPSRMRAYGNSNDWLPNSISRARKLKLAASFFVTSLLALSLMHGSASAQSPVAAPAQQRELPADVR